jgi:NAD(P)H-flavin reductase
VGKSITLLTIKDVHFKWRAGQHLYLWLPRVGALEAHPYTIACPHQVPETCICNSIQLVIRSHAGFSKRLHTFARKAEAAGGKRTVTAFVSGPYGRPPRWDIFETLLLISASTGASFTLPILESVLESKDASCTRRIDFLLTARQGDEIGFYIERLHAAVNKARVRGIELSVHVAVTGNGQLETISNSLSASASIPEKEPMIPQQVEQPERQVRGGCCSTDVEATTPAKSSSRQRLSQTSSDYQIRHSASRPDIPSFLQNAVEATGGETAVVICGGPSLVAKVRTSVAKLSDERAVHKGTGAQGIHLHVEEYCF